MTDISFADLGATGSLTPSMVNDIKAAVNSKSDDDHAHSGTYLDTLIASLADGGWTGQTYASWVAGEAIAAADFSNAYYLKQDSGTTKVYKYLADSTFGDRDYRPIGILLNDDAVEADSAITVSIGGGIVRNDDLSFVTGDVGKYVYLGETGLWQTTAPSGTGDWSYPVGILLDIEPTLLLIELPQYGGKVA